MTILFEFLLVTTFLLSICAIGAALADYVIEPLLKWFERRGIGCTASPVIQNKEKIK